MHPDAIHAREIKLAIPYAAYEAPDGKLERFGELWPECLQLGWEKIPQPQGQRLEYFQPASSMDVTRSLAGLPLREYLCGAGHDAFHPAMPAAIY